MLERYFYKPETIDRIQDSWLAEPIERYVVWLSERQYADRSIIRRVPMLMRFGEFAQAHGAKTWADLPDYIEAFAVYWLGRNKRTFKKKETERLATSAARKPIQQMLQLVVPEYSANQRVRLPLPFLEQVPGFFAYLKDERGLQKNTIKLYTHNLRRFESYLLHIDLCELSMLSPAVLSAFVTQSSQELSKHPLKSLCEQLRIFLRYLYREEITPQDLSISLDIPRIYRLSDIPRSITWDEVRQMLEAVDRRSAIGKRDYAILLLLVTYGLRSKEVAALTLKSVDWESERLRVPERKAGHSTAFPLSPIVGEAIVNYLQHGRPKSNERALFLRAVAPYSQLRWEAIAQRATHYLRKADIQVGRPGSHTLRHTCVQRLIDAHFSLKTIGDYIGHGNPRSTEIYTKINVEALRDMALGDGEDVL